MSVESPDTDPVRLVEDEQTGDRFLIYGTDAGAEVELHYQGDQLWMTQAQIAELYGKDVSVVSRHIAGILEEGELNDSNLQKMQIASSAKPVTLYALDMIISVGYRTSSKTATLFRRWATGKLVQFATKGFVVDHQRLKRPENRDRLSELREIIRDIRSDEANVYRELRRICAMCQDYDGATGQWQDFYRNTQAKLIYAVTSHTPAEIIKDRARSDSENMGLTNWVNDNIRKTDVSTSKNYLMEGEIKELNRLTTIVLDIFEDQSELGKLIKMSDVTLLLDSQLRQLSRVVLNHGGRVSMNDAKQYAELQYGQFTESRKLKRQNEADKAIVELAQMHKHLPKSQSRKK